MGKEITFEFAFYKLIQTANPIRGSRISIWREDNASYLVPSEFKHIIANENFYEIELVLIESDKFSSNDNIGKRFFFGTPNYILGYGILKRIHFGKK